MVILKRTLILFTLGLLFSCASTNNSKVGKCYALCNIADGEPEDLKWVEVICEKDVTPSLIIKIKESLSERGLEVGPINGILDKKTKNAIITYQQRNKIISGALNIETLTKLGIVFP